MGEQRGFDVLTAGGLAADITDQPAHTQIPTMAVELLGVGVAPRHHRRAFGDAQVRLPQPHPTLIGQAVETPDGGVQQLGVGRKADVLRLYRAIDRDPLMVVAP